MYYGVRMGILLFLVLGGVVIAAVVGLLVLLFWLAGPGPAKARAENDRFKAQQQAAHELEVERLKAQQRGEVPPA